MSTRKTLNPTDRQRQEFSPGAPVVLCDGQTWMIPFPMVRGPVTYAQHDPKTGEFVGLRERMQAADDKLDSLIEDAIYSEDGLTRLESAYQATAILLRQNYDLTPAEAARLLQIRPDDDDMWSDIAGVLLGSGGPKAGPVGGVQA
jgi:hypothetical protein